MTTPRKRGAKRRAQGREGTRSSVTTHVLASRASGSLIAVVAPQRSRALHLTASPGMDAVEFVITWTNGIRGTLQSLLDNGREVLDYLPTGDGVVSYKYETFYAGEHVLDWDVVGSGEMTSLRAHAGVNGAHLKLIGEKDKAQRWPGESSV